MKKLICILMCVLLCGCALSEPNEGLISGDVLESENEISAVEDIETINHKNFELIWDTSDINGFSHLSGSIYSDEYYNYYMLNGDKLELLEKRTHTANDGEHTLEASLYYLNDELVFVAEGAILSQNEVVLYVNNAGEMSQLYLMKLDSNVMTPLLAETAFGFSYDEYYALTSKWDTIFWCESFTLSPNREKIAYWSNKGTDGEKPVFEYGIWIYDLKSGEEYRLDIRKGFEILQTNLRWVSNDDVLYYYGDNDGYEAYRVQDINHSEENYEFQIGAEILTFDGNIMVQYVEDTIVANKFGNFEDSDVYYIKLESDIVFAKIVSDEKIIALSDRNNDVYVFDLDTDTYKVYKSEFGENRIEVCDITENGDIIVTVLNTKSFSIEGIYRLVR